MIGIYKIISPSGKVYIGQSWEIEKRWLRYRVNPSKGQRLLYRSLSKYGYEAHTFEVLHELPEDCTQTMLDELEIKFISIHRDNGSELLNLKDGGHGGGKHCEETKLLIGRKNKGKKIPEWQKELLRKTNIGRTPPNKGKKGLYTQSPEARKKISAALMGKKRPKSDDYRKKISEGLKGNIPWNKNKPGCYSLSEQTKQKISIKGKGRIKTDETRKKLSIANMGKNNRIGVSHKETTRNKISAKLLENGKRGQNIPVIHLEYGIYYSLREAAKLFGVSRRLLTKMICGKIPNETKLIAA